MARRFAWIVTINIIVLRCEEFFRLGGFIKGAVKSMPKFGTIYLHYKGNKHKYLYTATHSETRERLVIYQALYGEFGIWARPEQMFFENVVVNGVSVPRFKELGE